MTGTATVTRPEQIFLQARAGEPVFESDIIETTADGLVCIRFIDGTTFNLSNNARMALKEFPGRETARPALIDVARGDFAFIAGEMAKAGRLEIDTPVARIRGSARVGGIGTLSLISLFFAAMEDVQAAPPDAARTEDGIIPVDYSGEPHGSFELTTKESVPRRIYVDDPGVTWALRLNSSSELSISSVANSPAQMAQLSAIQQGVLHTYSVGLQSMQGPTFNGQNGSTTNPSFEILPGNARPINFSPSDPGSQNSGAGAQEQHSTGSSSKPSAPLAPPPPPDIPPPIPEIFVPPPAPLILHVNGNPVIQPLQVPDPGPIGAPAGVPGSTLTLANNFSFSDADVTDTHTVTSQFNAAASGVGAPLGTFVATEQNDTVNGNGGLTHWEYTVSADVVNAMPVGSVRHEHFDVNVIDNQGGVATHDVMITIEGPVPVNHAPVIQGVGGTASVSEDVPTLLAPPSPAAVVDADNDILKMTVHVSHGKLTPTQAIADAIANHTLTAIDGDGSDGTLVVSGLPDALTAAINAGVIFTPDHDYNGPAALDVTVDDGKAAPTSASVSINITPVNDAPTGTVTITGAAVKNQALTAVSTLADADGLGTLHYQWQRDGLVNVGADQASYTPGDADVGHTIQVVVSYTDGHGTAELKTSAPTAAVTNVNDAPTGTVTITGAAVEDQALTAVSTLADADGLGTLHYQWQRDGLVNVGADQASYTPGDADVGHTIQVVVSYTDGHGTAELKTSAPTAAVTNVNDAPTGTVTITGAAVKNQALTAVSTLADADGLGTLHYQWQRDGLVNVGADQASYTPGDADVGHTIQVVVSYTDGHGTAELKTSAPTAAVTNVNDAPTGTVTITGAAVEDQALTAVSTLADADGLGTLHYQWQRDGLVNVGADQASYTPGDADVGHTIQVVVSYTDGHGTAESKTSAPTAAVTNVNDAPTGTVTITGAAVEDQALTAVSTLADADGLGTLHYQWQRDGLVNVGADQASYTPGDADVGHTIQVVVSYTDGHGTAELKTSAPTAAVTNVNDAPTGTVTITGAAVEDQALTAVSTLADADGLGTLHYQWQRDGLVNVGADQASYTPGDADVGHTIQVVVSYTDGHGTAESKTSAPTAAVTNVNDAPTGTVTITGAAVEDQALTAVSTLADADGLGTLHYQWQRDGLVNVGADQASYTPGDADVGHTIQVVVSYTDGHGTAELKTSAPTAAVTNVNDAPTGTVTITGAAVEDQALTAVSTLADADGLGTLHYQWQRDGLVNVGADQASYTPGDADVGHTIQVVVSYTDGHGTAESKTSAPTAAVTNVNDAPTGTVTITGAAVEDQALTAVSTLADADGLGTLHYQWQRDGLVNVGADQASYTPGDADVGHTIQVVVSYTDGHGTAESKTSAPTAAVTNVNDAPTGTVTITGAAVEDQALTAVSTLADADGLGTLHYQWQRDGLVNVGADQASYTPGDADVGHTIQVVVSYTDGHGTAELKTSAPTAAVTNVNDAPTGTVTITGAAVEDQALTAVSTLADADGLGTLHYQWQRDGLVNVGADQASYTPGDADVGHTIQVVVSYTDGHGTAELKTSAPTAAVTNVNDAPVLNSAATPVLAAENEGAGAPVGAVGTLVSSLVDLNPPVGGLNNVTDADSGAATGIALTATSTTNGSWWYSLDSGAHWTDVNAGSAVSNTNALLLAADAGTRIYFQPNANFSGPISAAITFRAWDQSSGAAGTKASTATNGGTTAFSSATDTADITINAVDHAPVIQAPDILTRVPVPSAVLAGAVPGTDSLATHAIAPDMNGEGRYVVFFSTENVPTEGDNNGLLTGDVFLYDRLSGATTTLTDAQHIPLGLRETGERFSGFTISGDGNFVVFSGTYTVDGQFGPQDVSKVYLYDRNADKVTLLTDSVTHATITAESNAQINGNGALIALVRNATDGQHVSVYKSDGTLIRDVTAANSVIPDTLDHFQQAAISNDGNYVSFWAYAQDANFNPTGLATLYVLDRQGNSITAVGTNDAPRTTSGWVRSAATAIASFSRAIKISIQARMIPTAAISIFLSMTARSIRPSACPEASPALWRTATAFAPASARMAIL